MFDVSFLDQLSGISRALFGGFFLIFFLLVSLLWATNWLKPAVRYFYGDLSDDEIVKFSLLSLCFFNIIGVYWMLRTVKTAMFIDLVGIEYQPYAKMLTVVVLSLVLGFYSKLVDSFSKHRLFLIVSAFYALVFSFTALILKFDFYPMNNFLFNLIPGKISGWILYSTIDSLGGIIVGAVFWAFVASTTDTDSAKKGYPLIFIGAQAGNLIGPAFNLGYASHFGNVNLLFIGSAFLLVVPLIMELYMWAVPAALQTNHNVMHKKKKTGALEGIRLIFTRPYLIGVLIVSTVYDVIVTIVDYQFKYVASGYFSAERFTAFDSLYAMCTALIALLFVALGTGYVIRTFGERKTLLAYPVIVGVSVLSIWLKPFLGTFFVAMMVIKAFGYSLHNPVKEILYIPTSKDIQYKAKGFIDGFGLKGAKSLGSMISAPFAQNLSLLLNVGGMVSLGIIAVWFGTSMALGSAYEKLRDSNQIIE